MALTPSGVVWASCISLWSVLIQGASLMLPGTGGRWSPG